VDIQVSLAETLSPRRQLSIAADYLAAGSISPWAELGAYEWLWLNSADSFGAMADLFRHAPGLLPSEIVAPEDIHRTADMAVAHLTRSGITSFGIRVNGSMDYPSRLRGTSRPAEMIYVQGWADLLHAPRSVAVVGSREMSEKGARRTQKLVQMLVERDCVIVSGMERGIAAIAHETAIKAGGATMAVIATPLSQHDPRADKGLLRIVASDHLIVSAVPVLRYARNEERVHRMFAAERGKIMAALTDATIIVEAGAITSSVSQAETALKLGRKLFILNGCFDQPNVEWPARLEAAGAIRVRQFEQIVQALRK